MRYDRLLVTGGAGFIGSHVVDAILTNGASSWILDDLSTGSLRNLKQWRSAKEFHFQRGSTIQPKTLRKLTQKVDGIIHLGAVVSPFLSVKRPQIVNSVNVTGTMNVLNAALEAECQRMVFASSSSVYGDQLKLPITEESPLHPLTPYGVSKLAGEKYCEAYYRTYGLSTVSLRFFNIYGPRQRANPYSGVIAIFSKRLRAGHKPIIFGDGAQTRDFTYVSDVVRAILLALHSETAVGQAFNVGTGQPISIEKLASRLATLTGRQDISPTHVAGREGDIQHSYADIRRASQVLRFNASVELTDGLKQMLYPQAR